MATVHETIDRARLGELIERERGKLLARTEGSQRYYERALAVMPRGVPSSFQAADPRPIYLSHGEGSHVWDVDGNEYVDFHNGFGVMCVGHANPAIIEAVERARRARLALRRADRGLDRRRRGARSGASACRSGASRTPAPSRRWTPIHLARAATGRDVVLKIEGSYHGHHDAVMVSVRPPLEQLGERGAPGSMPFGAGHPRAVTEVTKAIPFNDADAARARARRARRADRGADPRAGDDEHHDRRAAQPVISSAARALCQATACSSIFDEVKTGCTIAAGGAVERFGVTPDIVCLAKATCGGYPGGAIGMTAELAALIVDGTRSQVGTFNGNPLVMAAAQAALTEVLTPAAYERFEALNARLLPASTR